MRGIRPLSLQRALTLVAGLLIVKVTAAVVLGYRNYFPPNFNSDFLHGREAYFSGSYHWSFYTHIASGPVCLLLGGILISDRFRLRFPKWHRRLGKFQIALLLLVLSPSGLWMSYYAAAGPVASVGFAVLAILTGMCAALGWRSAVQRRFAVHRRWMWRCFLLLCSAVVIRVVGGGAVLSGVQAAWFDPLSSWASWTVPLAAFELMSLRKRRIGRLAQSIAAANTR